MTMAWCKVKISSLVSSVDLQKPLKQRSIRFSKTFQINCFLLMIENVSREKVWSCWLTSILQSVINIYKDSSSIHWYVWQQNELHKLHFKFNFCFCSFHFSFDALLSTSAFNVLTRVKAFQSDFVSWRLKLKYKLWERSCLCGGRLVVKNRVICFGN